MATFFTVVIFYLIPAPIFPIFDLLCYLHFINASTHSPLSIPKQQED